MKANGEDAPVVPPCYWVEHFPIFDELKNLSLIIHKKECHTCLKLYEMNIDWTINKWITRFINFWFRKTRMLIEIDFEMCQKHHHTLHFYT